MANMAACAIVITFHPCWLGKAVYQAVTQPHPLHKAMAKMAFICGGPAEWSRQDMKEILSSTPSEHICIHMGARVRGTGAAFDLPEAVANEVLAQKEELATRHFVVDAPHSLPMDPSDDGGYMPSRGGRRGGGGGGGFRRGGGGGGGHSRGGGGGYSENS